MSTKYKYDENGKYLGIIVENLSSGPTDEFRQDKPYTTLGKIAPARGVNEFQNLMYNSIKVYGQRTAYIEGMGSFHQVLVSSIGGLAWINI